AINFSTYGASFVFVDDQGETLAPLYNYLKPYPEKLKEEFYARYGGEEKIATETASPVLGSLNSGMQLFRIREEKPELFNRIKYALHLPQYMSMLISRQFFSDKTSIGCHTQLWDFEQDDYHQWVCNEKIAVKMAPVFPSDGVLPGRFRHHEILVGVGLHDSSAALIPYLQQFDEPFVLLSTGTWSIALNPFDQSELSTQDLIQDCLSYLSFEGKPVKASRLFAGNEHEQQVKRIAAHFGTSNSKYRSLHYQPEIAEAVAEKYPAKEARSYQAESDFARRELSAFANDLEAYYQLMADLVHQQVYSLKLIVKEAPVKDIYVDGGFSKNDIYMHLLAAALKPVQVFAAMVSQATAIGTALAIHRYWNRKTYPADIVQLIPYSSGASPNLKTK
ncbi:MAG: carbohydrate kinase, partial [Mucilaginibacter polytrichastri]|nr:carbohydrate kinase [Mucilaginibacter polytrichastri]